LTIAFTAAYQLIILLNIVVYVVMMSALIKIVRIMKQYNDILLNQKAFWLHITSFTIFIISVIAFDIYYTKVINDRLNEIGANIYLEMICVTSNFIS